MKKILVILAFVSLPLSSLAIMQDDLESYSTTIQNGAGGTGFTGNWDNSVHCGQWASNNVSLSGVGSKSIKSVLPTDLCGRRFTAITADDSQVEYWISLSATNESVANYLDSGVGVVAQYTVFNASANIQTIDNTTLTTLVGYSSATTYKIIITNHSSDETYRININGTDYPSSSTYYHYEAYTTRDHTVGLGGWRLSAQNTTLVTLDDLEEVAVAASNLVPSDDGSGQWFFLPTL